MAQIRDIKNAGDITDQINTAIGVHGMWKSRILSAAETGMSEWKPEFVDSSHNCDFGKWLDSFPTGAKSLPYKKVVELHADFHKEAARVLKLALSGHKEDAKVAIAIGTPYNDLTVHLTKAMMEWREGA
jgi:hypothetical protein